MDELITPVRDRAMAGIKQKTKQDKGTDEQDNKVETVSPALIEKVKALKSNMALSVEERRMDEDSEAVLKMIPTGDYIELDKVRADDSSTVDPTERPVKYTVIMSDETLSPQFNTESSRNDNSDESSLDYTTPARPPVTDRHSTVETMTSTTTGVTESTVDSETVTMEISSATAGPSVSPSASYTTEESISQTMTLDQENTTTESTESTTSMDKESTTSSYATTTTYENRTEERLNQTKSLENITETVQIQTLSQDLLSKTKNVISENLQRFVEASSLNETENLQRIVDESSSLNESDIVGMEEIEPTAYTTEEPKQELVLNLTTENEIETTTSPIIVDDYESVEMESEYTTSNKEFSTESTRVTVDRSTQIPEQEVDSTEESETSSRASSSFEYSTDSSFETGSDVTAVIVNATSHATTTLMDDTTEYNLLGHLLNIHRNNFSDDSTTEGAGTTPLPSVQPGDLFTLPTTETLTDLVDAIQTTLSPIEQFLKLINDTFDLAERTNLTYPYYDTQDAPYDMNAVQYATKSLSDLISQTEKDFAASSQFVNPDESLNAVNTDEGLNTVNKDDSLNSINTDGTINKIPYYHVQKDNYFHIGEQRDVKSEGLGEEQRDMTKSDGAHGEKRDFKTGEFKEHNKDDSELDASSNVISSIDHYNKLYKKTREVLDKAYNERSHELFDKQFATSSTMSPSTTTSTPTTTLTSTTTSTSTPTSTAEDPVLERLFKPNPEKPYDISDFQKYQKPADSLFMIKPNTPRPVRKETPRPPQFRNPFISYPEPSMWRIPQEGPYNRGSVPQNQFYNPGYGRINAVKSGSNWVKSGHNWYGMDSGVSRNRFDQTSHLNNLASLGIKQQTVVAEKPPAHSIYKNEANACSGLFGYYADLSDCRAFFICSWGIPYRFFCPHGTLWNPSEGVCDWALNVDCTRK
ncbi:serine-rich adhesin for platelets-like [Gigantopelta aegis]|uniref:serine-rich adhesin for platelets-like n=1 Tax=Gigantopelta aegis TaxID=1735272 RepID=UPI001B888CC7|nr:serine-rich adhesin for platelets-like [Gigantopelta aegis]